MLPASGTNGRHTEDNLQNKTGDGKKLFFYHLTGQNKTRGQRFIGRTFLYRQFYSAALVSKLKYAINYGMNCYGK